MPRLTLTQRALWVTLVAAAAPYAFFRLALKPVVPFDADFTISEADLYDDLRDGEVAAAG
jgi:hypothetical protein